MERGTKLGRPRRYDLQPVTGFANDEVATLAAALDELLERTIDQIGDLPHEALVFAPQGTTLSIGALALHLAWAEANWITRVTGWRAAEPLLAKVTPAGRAVPAGDLPPVTQENAAELVQICREVRSQITYPALRGQTALDAPIPGQDRPTTLRGVLYHLLWHWTYHSAHIGLLRELWGSGYTWTFGSLGLVHSDLT